MFSRAAFTTSLCASAVLALRKRTIFASQSQQDYELCLVQVVFRHGARTPVKVPHYIPVTTYEPTLLRHCSQSYIDFKLLPLNAANPLPAQLTELYGAGVLEGGCEHGQLTVHGAMQLYKLGEYLRRKYVEEFGFLPAVPDDLAEAVYTRTTNVPRTIMSARSLLAGLFPRKPNCDLEIYTTADEEEILSMSISSCKAMQKVIQTWMNPPGFENMNQRIRLLFNLPPDERIDPIILRDNLEVEGSVGEANLDTALGSDLVQEIQSSVTSFMKSLALGDDGSTLPIVVGPLLDVLLKNMEDIRDGKKQKEKMYLYSGHDTTLIPLLLALNVKFSEWPSYASNIIIEFYRKNISDKDQYFVKVLYNGVEVCIGECDTKLCPFEDFIRYASLTRVSWNGRSKLCDRD